MASLELFWERVRHVQPRRAWFLLKRRFGQRWLDPPWLHARWDRLRQNGELQMQLLPSLTSLSPVSLAAQIASDAERAFFFGTNDLILIAQHYPKEFPDVTEQIVREANDLLQGRLHYAGTIIETELPFDWYASRSIPGMGKWHRIPAAFHWLKTLMQAFWLSGDERYAQKATELIESWLNCPHQFGHDIWKSTNFVGLRAVNLLHGLIGFASYWQDHPELVHRILAQLWLHSQLVERRMEYWGYNHLIWNAHDLTLLGVALRGVFKDAVRWARLGMSVMNEEVPRQIATDGLHRERSIHYQLFVSKLLGEWIALLWKAGQPLPPEVVWRWRQSVEVLHILRHADGSLPLYGDGYRTNDPNIEGDIESIADFLMALSAHLQGRAERSQHPLLPWKLGSAYWLAQQPALCEMQGASSGIASTRTRQGTRELTLCYLAGDSLAGKVHAHADSLSFTLSDEHGSILIDPGGYGEVADKWRTYFRSSYAHNTVVVDGHSMSRLDGVYGLFPPLRAALDGCWYWRDWCAWIAHHTNYRRLSAKVLHARTLLMKGTELVIVLDYLQGKQPFQVEQLFHFAEGRLEREKEQTWLWITPKRQWRLIFACTEPSTLHIDSGRETPIRGWSGEYRGRPCPIPSVICQAEGACRYWIAVAFVRPEIQLHLCLTFQKAGERLLSAPGGVITIGNAAPPAYEINWICDSL